MNPIYKLSKQESSLWANLKLQVLGLVAFVLSFSIGTEFAATKLGVTGRGEIFGLHNPFAQLIWLIETFKAGYSGELYGHSLLLTFMSLAFFTMLIYLVRVTSNQTMGHYDTHGSARWATFDEIIKAGLLNKQGLIIGGFRNPKSKKVEYLNDNSKSHAIVIAPTQSGKTTGLVIPNLLNWQDSVVIYDIKGENYELTSGYRGGELNQYVMAFNPNNSDGSTACFNPLNEIRLGINEVKDVQSIVEMLLNPYGEDKFQKDDHWANAARFLFTGAILHTKYVLKDKTIRGVLNFLTNEDAIEKMITTEHDPNNKFGWIDRETGLPTKIHPEILTAGRDMKKKFSEELSGVISTATAKLSLYLDPIISKNIERSDFTISDLIYADKPISLYLIIPPSDRKRLRPLLRLFVNQLCTRLMEDDPNGKKRRKLLLMLDEFASLGHMEYLEEGLSYMAGYDIRAFLILQDLDQLNKIYTKESPIFSHCKIRIAYATNSDITAKRLSGLAGESTILKNSKSYSVDNPGRVTEGVTEIKRSLITPDEVMRLNREDMLIFIENNRPIYGKKIYYKDNFFKKRYELRKVAKSDRLVNNKKSNFEQIAEEALVENRSIKIDKKNNFLEELRKEMND